MGLHVESDLSAMDGCLPGVPSVFHHTLLLYATGLHDVLPTHALRTLLCACAVTLRNGAGWVIQCWHIEQPGCHQWVHAGCHCSPRAGAADYAVAHPITVLWLYVMAACCLPVTRILVPWLANGMHA